MDEVDWEQFKTDLADLPQINSNQVLESFEEKWSPKAVAQYIIDTVKNC